jgi:uncharacterized repeat protein (TIGR02059 family)
MSLSNLTTTPSLVSGSVNGSILSISYSESLTTAYTPNISQYTLLVNGAPHAISSVSVLGGNQIDMTLASPVQPGQCSGFLSSSYRE